MKKLYLVLSLMTAIPAFAQTTIYSENFGNPSATTVVSSYTGYENASPITYTGTADVRTSTPSTGYTGASGNGCVFIGAIAPDRSIIISGINTLNYTNIALSFGQWKSLDAASNQMTVEVSGDGSAWTQLTYSRPSGSGTSIWTLINTSGSIPSVSNLRIKFTNVVGNAGYRVDDVKLTGTLNSLSVSDSGKKTAFTIFPTQVKDGIIHISSDKNAFKNIKIYDQSSKLMINTKTQDNVNVSDLSKGIYIIQVEENGKTETQKFMIN
ncbi:T9SS type A sorting domain-containing protein [Chryseobacterium shigense]|uniref:Secretion system C-terminal sorting domain-containing protein n=1 Tax=Chryseobacterium shigense TaxID=297244 RepID=A0A841NBU8_9FLAO|nr:T9SS type A sorting domain-containing protein [Chryseobacterium shigense]MBB6371178.1 hypothetical protein [Chryseobacterium shigense]